MNQRVKQTSDAIEKERVGNQDISIELKDLSAAKIGRISSIPHAVRCSDPNAMHPMDPNSVKKTVPTEVITLTSANSSGRNQTKPTQVVLQQMKNTFLDRTPDVEAILCTSILGNTKYSKTPNNKNSLKKRQGRSKTTEKFTRQMDTKIQTRKEAAPQHAKKLRVH